MVDFSLVSSILPMSFESKVCAERLWQVGAGFNSMWVLGLVLVSVVMAQPDLVDHTRSDAVGVFESLESEGDREVSVWLEQAARLEAVDARQALELADRAVKQADNELLRLHAQLRVASILRRIGDYDEALEKAEGVLAQITEELSAPLLSETLYLIGRLHWNKTDYATSIEVHLRQLELAESWGDALALSRAHSGLGLTYSSFGNREAAFHHLTAALGWADQANDIEQKTITINSLGNFHFAEAEYEVAARYHEGALQLRRASGNLRGIADSLNNLALIAAAASDVTNALSMMGEAEAIYSRLGLKRYLANVHRRTASILNGVGRHSEALIRLDQGLEIAESLGSPEVLVNLYREFAVTHEALANFQEALRFERLLNSTAERVRTEQDRKLITELNVRYQAERRENEIVRLKSEQKLREELLSRRHLVGWFIGGGLSLVIVVLGGAYFVQRRIHRDSLLMQSATENARERAEDADRLKSRLLQIASHDLKAPLAAMRATARRIQRETSLSTAHHLANAMRSDATRMEVLVRDLLDSTALEAAALSLDYTEFSLPELIQSVVAQMEPLAHSKEQLLTGESEPPTIVACADRERLWQILVNLVSNALKFSPVHGRVVVRSGIWDEWVSVEVEDDGPGLDPRDIAKIYGAPQQLSAKPTAGEHSSGLGLSITRELVALHCGRLEVESQPGKGSVFRVLLPATPAAQLTQTAL
jgi:signal transduction histidine kinase